MFFFFCVCMCLGVHVECTGQHQASLLRSRPSCLSLGPEALTMLALLDMEFQEPQRSSYNPSSGITAHATMLSFYRGLGIELGSSCLHGNHFTSGAVYAPLTFNVKCVGLTCSNRAHWENVCFSSRNTIFQRHGVLIELMPLKHRVPCL